ncbi:cysteine desulfurase [bacterium]|nr:cysteine desulfurase [bacterium]
MKRIYLDNAATTGLLPEVVDAMLPWLREQHGNPSSTHADGRTARVAVEKAREHVARMIGADPREIVFTAGGTESDNSALHMVMEQQDTLNGCHIISSPAEHHAVHMPLDLLAKQGVVIDQLGVDGGAVPRVDMLDASVKPSTILCTLMHVNNETGGILPLAEVGRRLHEHDVLFHSDTVQSAGKLDIAIHEAEVDFASMSAHKIHGPKGTGALYVRSGLDAPAFMVGGGQERGRRGGTENVAGIVGFGEAARLALLHREERLERWKEFHALLRGRLLEQWPDLIVNASSEYDMLPNILSVSFPSSSYEVDGAALLMNCDLAGVSVSGGSACTAGSIEASHVMRAVGHDEATGAATLRMSFGATTTREEVEEGCSRILGVLEGMLKS